MEEKIVDEETFQCVSHPMEIWLIIAIIIGLIIAGVCKYCLILGLTGVILIGISSVRNRLIREELYQIN